MSFPKSWQFRETAFRFLEEQLGIYLKNKNDLSIKEVQAKVLFREFFKTIVSTVQTYEEVSLW